MIVQLHSWIESSPWDGWQRAEQGLGAPEVVRCVGLGGPGPGQSINVYFPYNGWIRLIVMMMIVMLTKMIEKNLRLNAETGTDGSLYAAGEKFIVNKPSQNISFFGMISRSIIN